MRARNLKPSFFVNDVLGQVEPLGRILFQGLWCMADRAGRLEDRPMKIKVSVLPFDNCNVEKLLDSLVEKGFIYRYEKNEERYIQIINFTKHQHPHIKESDSTIPAPGKHHAGTVLNRPLIESPFPLPSSPLLNPERVASRKRFSKPTAQEATEYAKSIGFKLDGEDFCAYYEARGWKYGPGRPMVDWKSAVVTWKKKASPAALIQVPKALAPDPKPEDCVSGDDFKNLMSSLKSKGIPRA